MAKMFNETEIKNMLKAYGDAISGNRNNDKINDTIIRFLVSKNKEIGREIIHSIRTNRSKAIIKFDSISNSIIDELVHLLDVNFYFYQEFNTIWGDAINKYLSELNNEVFIHLGYTLSYSYSDSGYAYNGSPKVIGITVTKNE